MARAGVVLAMTVGLLVAGTGAAGAAPSGSSAPGVTPTSINVGAISTLTGSLAADFNALVPGVKAYFDMVNAQGGINGRKLNLAYNYDDGGSPSTFDSLSRTLVDQDHVFAVVGISSPWFSPSFFAASGTPVYGYNVTGNWSGPPNLFAAGGSYECDSCATPSYAYLLKQVKAKSVAILSYSISVSEKACSSAADGLKKAGFNIGFEDLNLPIDGNPAPDVQRMQRAGVDFVMTCTDVDENISLARDMQQYGLKAGQLWLNGSDQSVINKYHSLLQDTYFALGVVPTTAPTKYYPGLAAYKNAMKKYEPQYLGSALAVQGWESAALFAEGVKAAGSDLTQQRVIQLTNQITNDTAGGLTSVTNWRYSHTSAGPGPDCSATVKVKGNKLVPVFTRGHQVFLCFKYGSVKNPRPVTPPAGTPGT